MTDWPLNPTGLQTSGTYNAGHQDLVVVTATGALTIQLPAGTDQAMIGVKTVSNVGSVIPTELNTVTVKCDVGDSFNVSGGPASLDVSTVGQSLLLQYYSARHVWYVLAVDVDRGLVAAGAGPVVTAGQTVNTGAFFQSNTALDPTGTTDNGFKLFVAPSEVVWGLANTFDQPIPPGKGTIYQTLSVLQSKGLRSAVAVAGFATGEHVWGANFGGRAEMFANPDPLAYGIEVDFGILAANTGECVGLHLAAQDAAGNPAEFVSLDAEGFSYPGPKYGYTIGVLGEQDVLTGITTTITAGQIVDTTPRTLTVGWTAGFPASGTCIVAGVPGLVTYTGLGSGTLLGCMVASGSYVTAAGNVTSSAGQVPDVTGTLILNASTPVTPPFEGIPILDALHPGAFVYNGNYYLFSGVATTHMGYDTLTGVTLYNGTPAMSIPPAATIVVGTQPLGLGAVTANITSVDGAGQTIDTTGIPGRLKVGSTLGFPASGTCLVGGVAGQLVTYMGTSGGNTLSRHERISGSVGLGGSCNSSPGGIHHGRCSRWRAPRR